MLKDPQVSIVMIFLNEERYLHEAIGSVLAQTCARWELLLIDDGSTDASTDVAQRTAREHPDRIRYIAHEGRRNLGKSVSRNLGLREARGEYVTFLDADDVFRPEKVERQASILDRQAAAMVYGPTLYWYRWPGARPAPRPNGVGRLGVQPGRIYSSPQLLQQFLLDAGTVPCICGLTVRRTVALEVGGFDVRIEHLFEDQVFLAKICAEYPVFVDHACLDQYRQHAESTSRLAIADGRYHPVRSNPSHRTFLTWLDAHLKERDITDPQLLEALHRAWWPYQYPSLAALRDEFRRLRRRAKRIITTFPGDRRR